MSWFDGEVTEAEAGVAAGLLANIRFDPKDPDSYFGWHETRGIPRTALEAIYTNPRSKVRDLEKLYRKAGINIRDLRDLLDEAADSTTLDAVFKANKKCFGVKGAHRGGSAIAKLALVLALFAAGLILVVLLAKAPPV
ncbi:MAG: hypothetical protein ACR2PO_11145 [Methyloligellaceae bacterium]